MLLPRGRYDVSRPVGNVKCSPKLFVFYYFRQVHGSAGIAGNPEAFPVPSVIPRRNGIPARVLIVIFGLSTFSTPPMFCRGVQTIRGNMILPLLRKSVCRSFRFPSGQDVERVGRGSGSRRSRGKTRPDMGSQYTRRAPGR